MQYHPWMSLIKKRISVGNHHRNICISLKSEKLNGNCSLHIRNLRLDLPKDEVRYALFVKKRRVYSCSASPQISAPEKMNLFDCLRLQVIVKMASITQHSKEDRLYQM